MDIKTLADCGAFVTHELVPKVVRWRPDGGEDDLEFTVHVRRLSFADVVHMSSHKDDYDEDGYYAVLIEKCICLDGGKERFSYEQAYSLNFKLKAQLVAAAGEVNGFFGETKKSQPPTNFGTSSSLMESAAEQ